MIIKFLRSLRLLFRPLKNNEILMGSCDDFNMHHKLEQFRHGLVSPEGDIKFNFWNGDCNYRITILSTSMPYYIFDGEVLTRSLDSAGQFIWKKRSKPHRVSKSKIEDMILEGKLTRSAL